MFLITSPFLFLTLCVCGIEIAWGHNFRSYKADLSLSSKFEVTSETRNKADFAAAAVGAASGLCGWLIHSPQVDRSV